VGLVGAIVVVCTMAAGTPKADTEIQALDELAADAQSQQPVVAPATVPATQRPKRVLLVGDSVALTLGGGLAPLQSTYGVQVYNHGWVGCGIARRSMAYDGARYYPAWSDCAQWPTRWAQWRDQSQPDVAALLIGRWEVVDRNFHGRWTHIGDPQFDAYLAGELDNAVAVLSAKGARVMLMTAPVYHARELPDGSSSPVNNPERVARLNQLIREAVDRHPGVAQLYDLESVLTPGGVYQQTLSGVNVRFDDGVHISKQGAALIAQTLMPCLAERSRCSNNLTAASVPSGGG
jgi:hypothetical protein